MQSEYYQKKESVDEYIRLAKDVNGANLIERLEQYLPERSKLLEVGSGPGSDYEILSNNYEVVGSDNSKQFLEYLNARFPKGKFIELDAVSLLTDLSFDGIYSNKVLHHLTDAELKQSIIKQWKLLKKEGIICHSFWKGEGTEEFKGMFVNYHLQEEIEFLFQKEFEIVELLAYKEFESDDSIWLIAKKI